MDTKNSSCVIDYPGHGNRRLAHSPLSTRLRLLIVDPDRDLTSDIINELKHDPMLDVQYESTIPTDTDRVNAAIVCLSNTAPASTQAIKTLTAAASHIIIVCNNLSADIAKLAVQYKVDALMTIPELADSLYSSLAAIADSVSTSVSIAPLTTVLNGKAGSGATFITCCMSEVFASCVSKELAVIDADFNYASVAHGLHMENRYSITSAIKELDKLDEAAIRSMMTQKEQLFLIGNESFSRLNQEKQTPQQLDSLCWKIRQTFPEVFVDMSKGLELQTLPLLAQSTNILIVMQLSVASLRETKALIRELSQHIDLTTRQVAIVVNRYVEGQGEIKLEDVKSVLDVSDVFTISNNFELARLRTDLGRPLESINNHKNIARELRQIVGFITQDGDINESGHKPGFLRRLLRSKS